MRKNFIKRNFLKAAMLIVCLVAAVIAAICLSRGAVALAMTSEDATATVTTALYDGTANKFQADALTELYKQLGGKNCDTLEKVKELIPQEGNKIYTSNDIRLNNWTGEKDVVVELGGKKWTVTSLTSTRNAGGKSDVIATLWLANAEETRQFNNWYAVSETWEYPANMYGSSRMRAFLNGTMYATSNTVSPSDSYMVTIADGTDVQSTGWKNFIDKYKPFIVTPSRIEYQESECASQSTTIWYNLQNDAYGVPASLNWYGPQCDYSGKNMYSAWAADYLWIPSVTEIGYSGAASGLWEISEEQRSSDEVTGTRSGYWTSGNGIEMIPSSGVYIQSNLTHAYFGVRPAIHLNLNTAELSAAGKLAAPEKTVTVPSLGSSKTYNGVSQKIEITGADSNLVSIVGSSADVTVASNYSHFTVKEAGEYTLVCTLTKASEGYCWADGTNGTKYIYFSIDPFVSKVTWGNTSLTYSGKPLSPSALALDYRGGGLSLDFVYRRLGETIVLDSAPTDAGTYEVEAVFAENQSNYVLSGNTCTFTINKATPDIVPTVSGDLVYAGGKLPVITAPSGSVAGKCVWTETQLKEGSNIAEWVFIPDDSANYNVIKGEYTLIAQKAPPKTVVWEDNRFIYDGKQHAPVAYYINDAGEKVILGVTGAMSDAGEYTATVITVGVPYVLEGELSKNYTISHREIIVSWQSGQWIYNGEAQSPSVTAVTDYDGGDISKILSVAFKAKEGSSLTDGKAVEAGNYIAEVKLPENSNYRLVGTTSFSFTVEMPVLPDGQPSAQPLSGGAIAGIVLGSVAFVMIIITAVIVSIVKSRSDVIVYRGDEDGFYDDVE